MPEQDPERRSEAPEIIIPGQPPRREREESVSQPAKLLRIASMIRELLAEARLSSLDEAGRKRLHALYDRALTELKDGLSEDLQQELGMLTLPLEGSPSESEIRIAQAQLVGWLEGLFQGIQAALQMQQLQAQAQLHEMRRRGLPSPGEPGGRPGQGPGQYL